MQTIFICEEFAKYIPHLPYAFPLSLKVSDEYVSSKLKVPDTQVCNAIAPLTLIQQFHIAQFFQFSSTV